MSYKSIRRTTTTEREEKDISRVRSDNTSNEKQRHVLLSFRKLLKIAPFKINSSSTDWFTWMKCIIGIHLCGGTIDDALKLVRYHRNMMTIIFSYSGILLG